MAASSAASSWGHLEGRLSESTRAVAVERLDVNGSVPSRANDLSQSLRVVLIRLIDLHLKGSACMPGVETNDFEPEIAVFMHQPWRHRSGLWPRT
jgi:hypothetical protein